MLTRNQQDHSLFGLPPEVPGRAPDQSRGGQAQRHFLWSVLLLADARGAAVRRAHGTCGAYQIRHADSAFGSWAAAQCSRIRSLSVMATVPSSWPPARSWWPPTLDGGEDRCKIKQPRRAGCSRSLAEASSCSPAAGSSD